MLDLPGFTGDRLINRLINRRSFFALGGGTAITLSTGKVWGRAALPMPPAKSPIEASLDAFTADYMRRMNAPGMTQALTDTTATLRTVGYGFANVDLQTAVTPDQLFQIGSISKSFVALAVLQLREEGKLDLHRPVLEYLPWLPVTMPYGPITVHHLLTHSSGLPDGSVIFQSDPGARHAQGFAPGTHFHYSNLGFAILGQIIEKLEGKPWYQSLQTRILTPMGMKATAPAITIASSARSATGYQPFFDDEVYPRQGRLVACPPEVFDNPAGSVASTPGDMARYLRMLLNSGQRGSGRIVSAESFALLSTAYIKAPEFSPTASYGYGIAVDVLDGHKILRHTGGMTCFASSIHVDLDGGYAAFASINAMQGYRPTAITQYAVQLLRADRTRPMPSAEPLNDALDLENAVDYVGVFRSADGKQLTFRADGRRLTLIEGAEPILLQRSAGDSFVSTVPGAYSNYTITFGREKPPTGDAARAAPPPAVIEVAYGPDWYTNDAYHGDHAFPVAPEYTAFAGHYRSPGGDDARVFIRKGQLWAGEALLSPIGEALFRLGDDAWSPDTVQFLNIADGRARMMRVIDEDCWRMETGS